MTRMRSCLSCSVHSLGAMSIPSLAEQFYVVDSCVTRGGAQFELELKAWVHRGVALWDAKRVFLAMGFAMPRGPWKVLQDQQASWGREFASLGWDLGQHLYPSRQQLVSRGQEPGPLTHDEATFTTVAVIFLLLWWAESRRRLDDRQRAETVLDSLLKRVLSASTDACNVSLAPPEQVLRACEALADKCDGGVVGHCMHLRSMGQEVSHALAPPMLHWRRAVALPKSLMPWRGACASARTWLSIELARLAAAMDDALPEARVTSDALKFGGASSSGAKRRRIDEDYKRAVAMEPTRDGRASSGAAWARCTGSSPKTTAIGFENRAMRQYLCTGRLSFAGAKYASVAFDASRLGDPKCEHVFFHLWSADKKLGLWLPPQVSARGGQGVFSNLVADPHGRLLESGRFRNSPLPEFGGWASSQAGLGSSRGGFARLRQTLRRARRDALVTYTATPGGH